MLPRAPKYEPNIEIAPPAIIIKIKNQISPDILPTRKTNDITDIPTNQPIKRYLVRKRERICLAVTKPPNTRGGMIINAGNHNPGLSSKMATTKGTASHKPKTDNMAMMRPYAKGLNNAPMLCINFSNG